LASLADGTPLFVPYTLPQETIIARPVTPRRQAWHAEVETLVAASPDRVDPPCPHFGACGGCALQQWRDEPYREWKGNLLSQALSRAGFEPPQPLPYVPGLPAERRRIDFAVRREGTHTVLGLHAARSAGVVDLTTCLVLHPALLATLPPLRTVLGALSSMRRQASVVINLLDAGPDLLLRLDGEPTLDDRVRLTEFAKRHGFPRIAVATTANPDAEVICLHRPATTTLSGVTVVPPPGAFLQATEQGEAAIIEAVLAALPRKLTKRTSVAELYAGCGTLSFALAPHVRVAAYEGDPASVGALRHAANNAGLAGRVTISHRDLARQPLLAKELSAHAAVILDPPHAGASAQITQIAASGISTVIYVSCNPLTLSRDASALLSAGYRLANATAIDQFLWSPRLEAVCVFTRG
jgi:23S rRNA (uracil1939-C5)-methyltransferase